MAEIYVGSLGSSDRACSRGLDAKSIRPVAVLLVYTAQGGCNLTQILQPCHQLVSHPVLQEKKSLSQPSILIKA